MNPDLSKALSELAQKLGTSVEYLWPKLVGHAKISAATYAVIFAILAAICCYLVVWLTKTAKAEGGSVTDLWPAYLILLVAIILSVASLSGNIPDYFYPEAAALHVILNHH